MAGLAGLAQKAVVVAAADGNELTITFSRNDIGLTVARRVQ